MTDYEQQIREILENTFCPVLLEIEDESWKHAGHTGVHTHGGGHFVVRIVATCFRGKTRVERHRMVNEALGDAFEADIHALSIKANIPEEVS
jgi:BolA protein